jgi:hypothetical protein
LVGFASICITGESNPLQLLTNIPTKNGGPGQSSNISAKENQNPLRVADCSHYPERKSAGLWPDSVTQHRHDTQAAFDVWRLPRGGAFAWHDCSCAGCRSQAD